MNTDNKNENGSEAKAKEETATIKLGLDVHAAQITVCRQWEGLGPLPAQKLSWEKALTWIREQVEAGVKVHSCYEAGPSKRRKGIISIRAKLAPLRERAAATIRLASKTTRTSSTHKVYSALSSSNSSWDWNF